MGGGGAASRTSGFTSPLSNSQRGFGGGTSSTPIAGGAPSIPDDTMTPQRVVELMKAGVGSLNSTVLKAGSNAIMSIAGMSRQKLDSCVNEGAIEVLVQTLEVGTQKGYGGLCSSACGALWVIGKAYALKCRAAGAVAALEQAAALQQAAYNAKNALKAI